jgi:hypothetical protein
MRNSRNSLPCVYNFIASLKHRFISATLHGVISQKLVTFKEILQEAINFVVRSKTHAIVTFFLTKYFCRICSQLHSGVSNLKEAIGSDVFACKGYLNNHKTHFMSRKIFHLHCQHQLMLFRKIIAGYWRTTRNM